MATQPLQNELLSGLPRVASRYSIGLDKLIIKQTTRDEWIGRVLAWQRREQKRFRIEASPATHRSHLARAQACDRSVARAPRRRGARPDYGSAARRPSRPGAIGAASCRSR